ncbi:hypothetical protein J3D54_005880 [Pseudomonas sp. GGS8]|uniref:hypothetical protein n=1 Tax=Pseudomonas sp. GGS8 TaxID=2817892 RepID=UPI0020A0C9B0|nr:hypothetical protein [Pseudomonas sp. GGS8]MCP1446748.1 hypothetical protein [Pseudomonas sp. GGS8]
MLKADFIIVFSSSETVQMQVHLEAPQADLNAGGVEEQQDLYQPDAEQEDLLT